MILIIHTDINFSHNPAHLSLLLVLFLYAQPDKRSGTVEKITGENILVRYQNINRPFSMGDVFL
jgi:hypothetical protein